MNRSYRSPVLAGAVAVALLSLPCATLALPIEPAPEPVENNALESFVPRPDSITLQKSSAEPTLGNTLVVLTLGDAEIKRLKTTTGRSDLLAVPADGGHVLFRDDGQEGDAGAGDGAFSSLAHIDPDELQARADEETSLESSGSLRVPVFDQRTLVGEAENEPFDFSAFEAGQAVPLSPSGSFSGAVASVSHNPEEGHEHEGELGVMSAPTHDPGMNQFQDRVLMIHEPSVVADPTRTFDACTGTGTPMGPWTFGHLMTEMANQTASGIDPSTFTETWLNHWLAPQLINGFNVPARANPMQAFINDWRNASGGGALDLSIAPFRLLAITPRLDLRTTTGGGGGYGSTASGSFLDAGEARFTFGIVLPKNYAQSRPLFVGSTPIPNSNNCLAASFSVIFEYRVPKCECEDVRAWANAWIKLNGAVPGSNSYNGLLEKLTRTFTDRNANPARSNRSAIGQVRTNEVSLDPVQRIWEIREFQLRQMPWSFLRETTTADTPDDSFNNTNTFGDFVLETIVGTAGPSVPLFYPLGSSKNFLGAHPQTPNPGTTFWNAPNLNVSNSDEDKGRHLASLGACNGCHARETGLLSFQHIRSFMGPLPTVLSGFLTGITVTDPAGSGTVRTFDDLDRREVDINKVARMACGQFSLATAASVAIGPVTSEGVQVQSMSAPVSTDPDAPPASLAVEDFLREPVLQVH